MHNRNYLNANVELNTHRRGVEMTIEIKDGRVEVTASPGEDVQTQNFMTAMGLLGGELSGRVATFPPGEDPTELMYAAALTEMRERKKGSGMFR